MRTEPKSWSSGLNWLPLTEESREDLSSRVGVINERYVVDEHTVMEAAALSFYPDSLQLIRLKSTEWKKENLHLYYLKNGDNIYRLNGTSPPIHEVNARAPIALNTSNFLDYLRFFCFFVRGEEGPYLILESLDQPEIQEITDATKRARLEKHAYPARLNEIDDEGDAMIAAIVWHGDSVFAARFKIHPDGRVVMIDDEIIDPELAVSVQAPIT